jgi:DnaJ domain
MMEITAGTLREAADSLGISDRASLNEIRERYHDLLKECHPDRAQHDPGLSHERTILLKESFEILVSYCMNHQFSFRVEDLARDLELSPADYWMMRFGDDPIWG